MLRFRQYLLESAADESKLTHLEHLEDHPINAGAAGVQHAISNLTQVHRKLRGGDNDTRITTKFDGSPSIVFGHHPETGKFFVASKSAFNKTPKINYTQEDIQKNHGHAPGLVEKLGAALKHLPKVSPPRGVYQGDIMHSGNDVSNNGRTVSFTPNTITYSAPAGSEHGKAARAAKIGVAVHTAYKGDTFDNMKAEYAPKIESFGKHSDVHLIPVEHSLNKISYPKEAQSAFKQHLTKAMRSARGINHDAIIPHQIPLKTYINSTVRNGTKPTTEGFMAHYKNAMQKKVDAVKTPAAKQAKTVEMQRALEHVNDNKEHFDKSLELHHHLQNAKNVLVDALSSHSDFKHTIGGKKVKPEGFVVVQNNRPTKFVDRQEFSAANFNRNVKESLEEKVIYDASGKKMNISLVPIRMADGKIKRLPPGKSGSSGGGGGGE